jgi:hypothetical protein
MIPFKKDKKVVNRKPIKKEYIADMETDGLRFTEIQLKEMRDLSEKMYCNYSGLPSIYSYE